MRKCKKCGASGRHYCPSESRTVCPDSDGNFFTSMIIGMATHNAILGGVLGGDLVGGIIGAGIADSSSTDNSSSDCGSSSDFGGSSDGGSCVGDF